MVFHTEPSVLKVKEGKYVTIKRFPEGLQLCAVDHQCEEKDAPSVYIWRPVGNGRNQMAFCFHRGKDYYFPKVNGNYLTLEKAIDCNNTDNISDSHLFEKENLGGGEHYGLRTVVEPCKYLKLKFIHQKKWIFILSEKPQECVHVIDEKIEVSFTNSASPPTT